MQLVAFIDDALKRRGISAFEFERLVGDRYRHVRQGRQKPPLASLHRWADVLHLTDDERLQLLALADEAHGGGTIAGWIGLEIARLRAQAAERDHLIAEMAVELRKLQEHMKKQGENR